MYSQNTTIFILLRVPIVRKSVDRDCKSNPLEGEGNLWDPKFSLGRGKLNLYINEAGMPHVHVM
jgi:hypothetical protein